MKKLTYLKWNEHLNYTSLLQYGKIRFYFYYILLYLKYSFIYCYKMLYLIQNI